MCLSSSQLLSDQGWFLNRQKCKNETRITLIEILTDNDLPTLVIVLDVIDCNRQVDDASLGKLSGVLEMGVVILAWCVFNRYMMVGVSMSDFKKYLIPGHHCDTFVHGIVHKNSDSIGRQGNAIGSDEAGKKC